MQHELDRGFLAGARNDCPRYKLTRVIVWNISLGSPIRVKLIPQKHIVMALPGAYTIYAVSNHTSDFNFILPQAAQRLSQEPSSLSLDGQFPKKNPPFWTGKSFYEEFSILTL